MRNEDKSFVELVTTYRSHDMNAIMSFFDRFFDISARSIMYTHDDLDGYGCDIALSSIEGLATSHIAYKTIFNIGNPKALHQKIQEDVNAGNINQDTPVLITDLCANKDTVNLLIERNIPHLIVDHHIWDEELLQSDPMVFAETGASATVLITRLVYMYFDNKYGISKLRTDPTSTLLNIFQFASDVSDYDTGDFGIIQVCQEFDEATVKLSKRGTLENLVFQEIGGDIYRILKLSEFKSPKSSVDQYKWEYFENPLLVSANIEARKEFVSDWNSFVESMNRFQETNDPNFPMLDIGTYRRNNFSLMSYQWLNMHKDTLFIASYDSVKDAVSLRSNKDYSNFNCRELAVQFGGGGHWNAAGFPIDPELKHQSKEYQLNYIKSMLLEKLADKKRKAMG